MDAKKILLIEDEEYIRDLYKRQLDLAGLATDGFGTGNEGLAALKQNHYDLVMLDIMLPDTNGLQILKEIKNSEATKNIPVVMLTNLGQDAVIKEGFELGAEGYLLKSSYTPNQIVEEIKNVLIGKQQTAPAAS
jgi:two-component system, OmpR family, response regulator ResD